MPARVRPAASPLRSPTLLRRALVGACALGLAVGLWQAAAAVPWSVAGGASRLAWVERYASLRPFLTDVDSAQFLHDYPPGTARHRLYRAQFELAPCVLVDRPELAKVSIASLRTSPLILDFHTAAALDGALMTLTAAAERQGWSLEVERLPGALAIVRARRAPSGQGSAQR
jgi:hypothetical protein